MEGAPVIEVYSQHGSGLEVSYAVSDHPWGTRIAGMLIGEVGLDQESSDLDESEKRVHVLAYRYRRRKHQSYTGRLGDLAV